MNKNLVKIALLGALAVSSAYATEMRTPWISTDGPLRYSFEKFNKDKSNLNLWSATHVKEAHKAFLKHGTDTHDLAALIFNKSSFTIDEAFPDHAMPLTAEEFNPLVAKKTLHPSVQYMEYGVTLGGRWDYPVWNNKGRIGIRASVPFRRIEMERQDSGLIESEDPTTEFVKSKLIRIDRLATGADAGVQSTDIMTTAYRMDLILNLRGATGNALFTLPDAARGGARLFGTQLGEASATAGGNYAASDHPTVDGATANPIAALAITDPGNPGLPLVHGYMMKVVTGGAGATPGDNGDVAASTFSPLVAHATSVRQLPAALTGGNMPDATHLGFFDTGAPAGLNYFAGTAALATAAPGLWLVFKRAADSTDPDKFNNGNNNAVGGGSGIARTIDNILKQWNQNAFAYLASNGYYMEDYVRAGMGDIDVDFFYEHTFNKEWNGEVCVGVRLPTGGDKDKYGNPYKMFPGNGEHWEIKLGGLLAYQPLTWMNVKADASWNFVLEGTEHRMAVFAGSTIKNFGPYTDAKGNKADADVDWGYFRGHLDFTFFHPKTSDVRTTLGYEFYYKTEDHLTYKTTKMQPWFGGLIGDPNKLYDLDSNLARKNTESIAHKFRFESSYQFTKYVEVFVGASATFAGQNAMRDRDANLGFNVRF